MYRLKLLSEDPSQDIFRILTLTAVSAYYGLFFAVPLRRYFVIKVKLLFPSPTASAVTIRSLHDSVQGEGVGKVKAKWMLWSFVAALLFSMAGWLVPGILKGECQNACYYQT
jgi:uncharacterized oligopeptide transporter (OPT) family protein